MSIFLCWSGDRSHDLACALRNLVLRALRLPEADVFVSDRIEKGVAWFPTIATQLQSAAAGIVCLTAENLDSPWLHFEAGALAMRLANEREERTADDAPPAGGGTPRHRLFTLLHGVTGAELKGPLGAYQATSTTRQDLSEMIGAVARILCGQALEAWRSRGNAIDEKDWDAFAACLERMAVPARKLVPELESLFQRKTFNEPLYRCADQAWVRRYDAARLTHDKLAGYLDRVRRACSAHESGLFEILLAELDGYAMAIQSLLFTPRTFTLGDQGELDMETGIRTSCEDRRLAIRSLAGRLLRPLDDPLQEAAVRFMRAETHEERKMIIHRMEGGIRREREVAFENAPQDTDGSVSWRVINTLTEGREPIRFRESSWDLDRIYFYLLVQYFGTAVLRWQTVADGIRPYKGVWSEGKAVPLRHDWLCAARDVEMEVERYRARSKGGSLSPLTYALCALCEIARQEAPDAEGEVQARVTAALDLVDEELRSDVLLSDAGRAISRTLTQMRAVDGFARRPRPVTRT